MLHRTIGPAWPVKDPMTSGEPGGTANLLDAYRPSSAWEALARGLRNRCPACGEGRIFRGWLKVVPECSACGAPLGALRSDDAPPYFTILIAGHVLVPPALMIERAWHPPVWVHMAVWPALLAIACILILRPVKGAVIGWMLRLGITGQESSQALGAPPRRDGDA